MVRRPIVALQMGIRDPRHYRSWYAVCYDNPLERSSGFSSGDLSSNSMNLSDLRALKEENEK